MSFNYTPLINTTKSLIDKFGKSVTITQNVVGTFDPAAGTESGGSTQTDTFNAVILPISDKDYKLVPDGLEISKMFSVTFAGIDTDFTPKVGDTVTASSVVYNIKSLKVMNPNATGGVIFYKAIVSL